MIDTVDVTCPIDAEPDSRAFYRDLVGLVEISKPPSLVLRGGCWFEGCGVRLRVTPQSSSVIPQSLSGADPVRGPVLISLDLEGLAERLAADGYPVTWNDDGLPGNGFRSVDPHGNPVEFAMR